MRHAGFASSLGATLAFAALAWATPGPALAQSCAGQKPDIAVGGTVNFDALADPSNSAQLRASCRVTLYIHDFAWTRMLASDDVRTSILKTFAGTGPDVIELGIFKSGGMEAWDKYRKLYAPLGVKADQDYAGGITKVTVDQWKSFVDEGRSLGLRLVIPIFSPNSGQWEDNPFSSAAWNDLRTEAQYGGGIAVDAPPRIFFKNAKGYQDFIEDEMRWARQAGLQATFIISPNISKTHFAADTQKLFAKLSADGALPTFWIVENYRPPEKVEPGYPNAVGSENDPLTVTGVALWLAQRTPRLR
jgi:hypothetical protein